MKKLSFQLILISCIFAASTVSAQGVKLVIHGGANMGKIEGKSFDEAYQLGYHLGVTPEIMFTRKWGFQPEILFSQTNTTVSSAFQDIYKISIQDLTEIKLNYLNIPLLLSYRPVSFFTLQAGPQFSILMNKHNTLLKDGGEAFKNGDFSLVGGAQIQIFNLRLYGRYALGLFDINGIDNRDYWRNQVVQLGVGFAL